MTTRADILPLAAGKKRAAALLDLPVKRFEEYVQAGILPGPKRIGNDERWDVEELRRVLRGESGLETVQW